ncbi:response regulator [Zoogloea sp.]|uniref:response regulator n=1 Tax=Zoogloea sp. TaxID=49181 RepID=UPI0035B1AEC2|nr:response regulator [Rhodocyclales bacterium]
MNTRRPLIYLVDDDAELRQMLAAYLERNGLEALGIPSGDELLRRLKRLRPDLIVLDLMMPGLSGLDACRRLRVEQDEVPIIMLTARADLVDRIVGLESGADDYLGKPFDPRELLARIQAVLRRRPIPALPSPGEEVTIGAWRFHPTTRSLHGGEGGADVQPLSDAEFALLKALTERPGLPQSREKLLEAMHGRDVEATDRSVDVAIHRLRKLLEPDSEAPRYIQTMRGRGYVFVPEPPAHG